RPAAPAASGGGYPPTNVTAPAPGRAQASPGGGHPSAPPPRRPGPARAAPGPVGPRGAPGPPPGGGVPPAGLEDLETMPQQRFDPATGQPLSGSADQPAAGAAKTLFFGALQQQPVVPRLVVIKGEGGDGATY